MDPDRLLSRLAIGCAKFLVACVFLGWLAYAAVTLAELGYVGGAIDWLAADSVPRDALVAFVVMTFLVSRVARSRSRSFTTVPGTAISPLGTGTLARPTIDLRPPEMLARVARHEAAHAVVASVRGLSVPRVSIEPGLGYEGRTMYVSSAVGNRSSCDALFEAMVATVAAHRADVVDGFHDHGSSKDMDDAVRHAAQIVGIGVSPARYAGAMTVQELMDHAIDEADRTLFEHRHAVDVVSAALLRDRTLDEATLRVLITDAGTS